MSKIRKATVIKYLNALNQIRFDIVELGNNKINMSGICRDFGLSKSAASEMIRSGIVKNVGKRGIGASYIWNTILPNEIMAMELIKRINYRSNKIVTNSRIKDVDDIFVSESTKIELTLSEKIVSTFPNNTLLEIKLAIDKLLTDKAK